MTLGPSTIRPSARLEAMVERMRRQKLTNLPVTTSDGRLVGLLTLRDAEEGLRQLASLAAVAFAGPALAIAVLVGSDLTGGR